MGWGMAFSRFEASIMNLFRVIMDLDDDDGNYDDVDADDNCDGDDDNNTI